MSNKTAKFDHNLFWLKMKLFKAYQTRIENYLDQFLSTQHFNNNYNGNEIDGNKNSNSHKGNSILLEAIRYSVLNGGKRIRPLLVYVIGETLGAKPEQLDAAAGAIELIHCYSLIHDDLPAMDNDDLRRGKPTCHKAFDEATAILAGDALQSLAFELLSDEQYNSILASKQIQMVKLLAKASGITGMVGGQVLDMSFSAHVNMVDRTTDNDKDKDKGKKVKVNNNNCDGTSVYAGDNARKKNNQAITLETLSIMHQKKTGALIQVAVQLAAIAADCKDEKTLSLLQNYAENLGLAFQVQDDILDVEGSVEVLGKNPGQDAAQNKQTFTELLGLDAAKSYMQELYQKALGSVEALARMPGGDNKAILDLTTFLFERNF